MNEKKYGIAEIKLAEDASFEINISSEDHPGEVGKITVFCKGDFPSAIFALAELLLQEPEDPTCIVIQTAIVCSKRMSGVALTEVEEETLANFFSALEATGVAKLKEIDAVA